MSTTSSTKTQKRIFFVRHGQAYHNITYPPSYHLSDPSLTSLGIAQAKRLSSSNSDFFPDVELVVSSPLRRTIQTSLIGLGPTIQRLKNSRSDSKGILLLPHLQEVGRSPCDTGSGIKTLKEEFGKVEAIDWEQLDHIGENWNCKKGCWSNDEKVLRERGKWLRKWLRDREESVIVVVAHHNVLEYITSGRRLCAPWYNCETREYCFSPSSLESEDATLELVSSLNPPPSPSSPTHASSQTLTIPNHLSPAFASSPGTPGIDSFTGRDGLDGPFAEVMTVGVGVKEVTAVEAK